MKWWLIAWREIRWEVFLDRTSLLRTGIFVVIPLFFVLSNRGISPGPAGDVTLIGLALQSVFFPALSGVALIAATFSAEKENGTLVPLLAAPIRDFDIVLGKLVGMVVPVMVACVVTLAAAYALATYRYGATRVERVLTPEGDEYYGWLRDLTVESGVTTTFGVLGQVWAKQIKEIDATARELFLTTFAEVRDNFRQIFMSLFGGGECDLRLENPDAPLDCDIEIHASPRGKRTQRIHLLSSGERALVALSLLFGIFLTKPSPFCLLDEVDAPLDDANVGRFVRMLNQFKSRTQFIVITHNPRTTTEAADAVYGVTMQEPGVSSVVSVRMRGAVIDDMEAIDGIAAGARKAPETVAAPA